MSNANEVEVDRLIRRAESALRRSRSRREVEPLLVKILALTPAGSDAALFAHRHIAELQLEESPWTAALHLRKVLEHRREDDVGHALLGLCHALLSNFGAAVASYRRALAISPRNPWYHHNLGHLLDVALSQPARALEHLTRAHEMEPLEDEITASLAHCHAMLGQLVEAASLAKEAAKLAPKNSDHVALLAWVEDGAPAGHGPDVGKRGKNGRKPMRDLAGAAEPVTKEDANVLDVLERGMREAGYSPSQLERARALFRDFRDKKRLRIGKPEVYAAAVEYAITLVQGIHGVTQAAIARRYGIAKTSLSSRYGEIRDVLSLEPGDPRYAS